MTIDEMRWILELSHTRNMSKAAENLYVSQPALSQCVRRVERQLGIDLFTRSNKGLEPTPKGLLFFQTCETIVAAYDSFQREILSIDQAALCSITIGMGPYLSMKCSSDLILALHALYPDIQFSVREAYTPELKELLLNNEIQLVVARDSDLFAGADRYPFGDIRNCIYLRNGSPLASYAYQMDGMQYLDPVYLAEEPMAMLRKAQSSRKVADGILAQCNITPHVVIETHNIHSLYKYARDGIASSISLALDPLVQEDLAADEHVIYYIPPEYALSRTQYAIFAMPAVSRIIHPEIYQTIKDVVRL